MFVSKYLQKLRPRLEVHMHKKQQYSAKLFVLINAMRMSTEIRLANKQPLRSAIRLLGNLHLGNVLTAALQPTHMNVFSRQAAHPHRMGG